MKLFLLAVMIATPALAREPLSERIVFADPAKYRAAKGVHGGAGILNYMGMFDGQTFNTNFLFLHRGILEPKSGIGHHYHNQMEEMFVILDNEAEFTIDGRTSRLAGPAGAPCRMGRSHGIYNPTDRPTPWMNIAISSVKAKYDATDLGDDRTDVQLDRKPVFITMRLDRGLLRPVVNMNGGKGTVQYRRALQPEVFFTNWAYVDHAVVPSGASIGKHRHQGVEEFYYVMNGRGVAYVNDEKAEIVKDHAIPILLNDVHSFENTGTEPLEFLIVGVAREKGKLDTTDVP